MDDESVPLSQLANEAFNPIAPHDYSNEGPLAGQGHGPTNFAGLAASLAGSGSGDAANGSDAAAAAAAAAGPGPSSAAQQRLSKSGKLFNVGCWSRRVWVHVLRRQMLQPVTWLRFSCPCVLWHVPSHPTGPIQGAFARTRPPPWHISG